MSQKRRRITAKRKQEIVLRLLKGEALDVLSRVLNTNLVTALDNSFRLKFSLICSKAPYKKCF